MRSNNDGAVWNEVRPLKGPSGIIVSIPLFSHRSPKRLGNALLWGSLLACLLAASPAGAQELAGFKKERLDISKTGINLKAEQGVGGLDFLSDGRMVLLTHGVDKHSNPRDGKLWLLSGVVEGQTIKAEKIADDMPDPLGLAVVNDTIYIGHKEGIFRFLKDGSSTKLAPIAWSGNYHEYHYSLVHHDGYLYSALGQHYRPKDSQDRGGFLKTSLADGSTEYLAGGLRECNGVGVGPEGELFVADNQGHWLPSSKLVHVEYGDHFGYENSLGPFPKPASEQKPPVVWFPHGEVANSPMQPVLIPKGLYALQMLVSDYRRCNLMRVFMEKVQGQWQGALFELWDKGQMVSPANRMTWGPDGALYLGGQGRIPNWSATCNDFSIQKVTLTDEREFDILAMRSVANGFELEFTETPGASAMDKGSYELTRWGFKPQMGYGAGNKVDARKLEIQSVEEGTQPNRVILAVNESDLQHGEGLIASTLFKVIAKGVKSVNGGNLRDPRVWYTLNKVGPGVDVVTLEQRKGNNLSLSADSRALYLRGACEVRAKIRTLEGRVLEYIRATGPAVLPLGHLPTGVHFLTGTLDGVPFAKKVVFAGQ